MLEKVQEDRLKKLQAIKELGIDPYGRRYDTARPAKEIIDAFEKLENEHGGAEPYKAEVAAGKLQAPTADAAGRLILIRDMGKMMFAHIRDESHDKGIQICLRKDQPAKPPKGLDETQWKLAKLLDLGDIVAASGEVHRTKTGEITIWADQLTLLTKSLNPMPEKWHGLSDVQTRYRQRYLDLMSNPDSLAVFKKRIKIIEHFRSVLHGKSFVEVETPMMQSIYGGAAARPFTTHHNTLDIDLFMRISPELYLKRLLVGGMAKVFEINRNFRNEGIDTRHNPEFTMMELYQAYADYEVMMDITEELISGAAKPFVDADAFDVKMRLLTEEAKKHIATVPTHDPEWLKLTDPKELWKCMRSKMVGQPYDAIVGYIHADELLQPAIGYKAAAMLAREGKTGLPYWNVGINFSDWRRAKYYDLVAEYAGIDPHDSSALRGKARSLGIEESNKDDAVVVNEVFELLVEPALARPDERDVLEPKFVMDYPAAICPLTRRKADDPSIALRFECFIAGMEIANAYTELNDPAVQEENFRQQLRGEAANETMRVMDEDFVTALRHGMPPAGGLGIGIDRVVMLLTNTPSIRDVVLFPLLRPAE